MQLDWGFRLVFNTEVNLSWEWNLEREIETQFEYEVIKISKKSKFCLKFYKITKSHQPHSSDPRHLKAKSNFIKLSHAIYQKQFNLLFIYFSLIWICKFSMLCSQHISHSSLNLSQACSSVRHSRKNPQNSIDMMQFMRRNY